MTGEKNVRKVWLMFLICISLLTGCGKLEGSTQEESNAESLAHWKEGFIVTDEITEEQRYWIQEYIPWKYDDIEMNLQEERILFLYSLSPSCTYQSKIYRLNAIIHPPYVQAVRWILWEYDTETMECYSHEISYEQLGQDKQQDSSSFLVDMDVVSEGEFIFQWTEVEEDSEKKFHQTVSRMIYSDLKENSSAVDLWGTYLQKGIVKDDGEDAAVIPHGYCVCDGQGNTYVKAEERENGFTKLYVFDRTGQAIMEYRCDAEQEIGEPMRMESGELVFPVRDVHARNYIFLWPDTTTGEMRKLGQLSSSQQIEKLYGMQGNSVYYQVREGIIQWDVQSGKRNLVFHFQENGVPMGYKTMLVLRKDAPPILRVYSEVDDSFEDWLVVLSDKKVEGKDVVRVANLTEDKLGIRQVSECATLSSKKDLNCLFSYESHEGSLEDYRTKIMAELVAGEGPDLLYVSPADMEILQKKGILADMNEFLTQETMDRLLPGVIQMGSRGGQLIGLTGNVTVLGMAVSRDVWKQDTWTLEDVISLMERGSLESSLFYGGPNLYFSSFAVQKLFIEYSLEESFLIDWEKRESHFKDMRMNQFLDLTAKEKNSGTDESGTWLADGTRVAFFSMDSRDQIPEMIKQLEKENGRFVGFPTEGVSGNYLDAKGMLVVNANSNKKKEIAEYLENFFGEEIQGLCKRGMYTNLSVCKLTGEEASSVEFEGLSEEEREQLEKERAQAEEDRKLAEAFLESCVPAPRQYPELNRIIEEELGTMAEGDKDARQVAEIIHKRIQIFLDEGYS